MQNALKDGMGEFGPGETRGLGRSRVAAYGRMTLLGALLAAGTGVAVVHAQTVLGDPRDAPKIFASNCSACHKSPRGLAKSGQIAGFLRQHYTTGPEMSAAMAAYLVAAGAAPPEKKKTAATDEAAAGTKSKGKQAAAAQAGEPGVDTTKGQRRTKQQAKSETTETVAARPAETPAARPAETAAARPAAPPVAAEEAKPAPAAAPATAAPAATAALATPPAPAETRTSSQPAPMVLDIPLPEMPVAPPADLTQSVFSSSPLP